MGSCCHKYWKCILDTISVTIPEYPIPYQSTDTIPEYPIPYQSTDTIPEYRYHTKWLHLLIAITTSVLYSRSHDQYTSAQIWWGFENRMIFQRHGMLMERMLVPGLYAALALSLSTGTGSCSLKWEHSEDTPTFMWSCEGGRGGGAPSKALV